MEWISANEPPTHKKLVIVNSDKNYPITGFYDYNLKRFVLLQSWGDQPTHWMEIPELPELELNID